MLPILQLIPHSMEQAFLHAIRENQQIIFKVCKIYRNSKEDQEDLFQEIVYQLWKSYPRFRAASKLSTWIYRIALNTAMAVYRKATLPVSYYPVIPGQHASPENIESEKEAMLLYALRQLNDADKAIIALYLDDFSYQEIAAITGITENNAGVRLNRIKNKLKQIIQ